MHAKHYAFRYTLLNEQLIEKFHRDGIEVWAWTVDDKDTAYELAAMGVDGLITNHPKKMTGICHPSRESVGAVASNIFDQLLRANSKTQTELFKKLKNVRVQNKRLSLN